jgi:predicted nucleotidyltransferase
MKRKLDKRLHTIGNKIKRDYSAERVILFGSYAKGNATEDCDVDLLVVAPTKERFFERMASVRRLIRDLRDGLAVSPIVLTPGELEKRRQAGDPFVQEILDTGVSL